jgi:hypothetical protein
VKAGVDMGPRVTTMPDVVDVRRRRLAGPRPRCNEAGYLTLVRGPDGLLDWQVDAGPAAAPLRAPQRRSSRRGLFDARPIDQVAYKPVQGSQVSAFLKTLDDSFNPRYGLYRLDGQPRRHHQARRARAAAGAWHLQPRRRHRRPAAEDAGQRRT